MVRTGINPRLEHGFAYMWAGLFLTFGYAGRRPALHVIMGLALLACAMELGQYFVEERHPAVFDAIASASGGALGWLAGLVMVFAESLLQGRASIGAAKKHEFSEP